MLTLLLSHLRLAEFSVDNRRTDAEIRRLDGAEHCVYSRKSVRLRGGGESSSARGNEANLAAI